MGPGRRQKYCQCLFAEFCRVAQKSGITDYNYPIRPLLGFSPTDEALIQDSLLRHLGG
ncbi:phage virion morphogenesis protein [Collimonas sp. H4R21]|uniref:Phage virion morphogenesis protein n=1 Tax=Collimonas rhizosphaerae TaxID=3126357 RepID=A0ABU9Q1U2_9BURK